MSVVVSKRKLSKLQVIVTAEEIVELTDELCIRDFGIKGTHVLREKYNTVSNRPDAMLRYAEELNRYKTDMYMYSKLILVNCRTANRSKMKSLESCNERLKYQKNAITYLDCLYALCQRTIDRLDVDMRTFKELDRAIDYERKILNSWTRVTVQRINEYTVGNV